ncbi:hypothetical protein ACEPAG_3135 [Sanghuangporus baumii]
MRSNPMPQKSRHPSIDIQAPKASTSRTFLMPSEPYCNPRQAQLLDDKSPKTHLCKSKLLDTNKFRGPCVNASRSFSPTEDDFDSEYHCDNGLREEGYTHGRLYCKNSLVSVTITCGCITTDMAGSTQEYMSEEKPSRYKYFTNQGVRMRSSVSRYGDHSQLDYRRTFFRPSGNNQLASIISTKREPGFFIE